MDTKEFIINGIQTTLSEKDYIFSIIFNGILEGVEKHLWLYRKNLDALDKLGKRYIVGLKGGLNLSVNSSMDIIDNFEDLVDQVINTYLQGEVLESESSFSFKRPFDAYLNESSFIEKVKIILKSNMDNTSLAQQMCDLVDEGVKEGIRLWQQKFIDSGANVAAVHMTFQEFYESEKAHVDLPDLENLYSSDKNEDWYVNWGNRIQKKYYSWMEEYVNIGTKQEELENAQNKAKIILQLQDPQNRMAWVNSLENECIHYILRIMDSLAKYCKIPLETKYCDWDRYKEYFQIYINGIQNNQLYLSKQILTQNLLKFPFITKHYDLILRYTGDENNQINSFANFLHLDITSVKKKILDQFAIEEKRNLNLNEESEVVEKYNKLIEFKQYLGCEGEEQYESELTQKLNEFDIMHRTVNGILYDTREKADEVRSRSFEGKEYDTKEQAELVKKEVETIRQGGTYPRTIEKYRAYKEFLAHVWNTEEASIELKKLDDMIKTEYQEICRKSEQVNAAESNFKITGIVGIVLTILSFLFDTTLGVIVLIISAIVVYSKYKKMMDCRKASQDLMEMNREFQINGTIAGDDFVTGSTANKICPRCGAEITNDMKFCSKCGMSLKGDNK